MRPTRKRYQGDDDERHGGVDVGPPGNVSPQDGNVGGKVDDVVTPYCDRCSPDRTVSVLSLVWLAQISAWREVEFALRTEVLNSSVKVQFGCLVSRF
jgi:hypothetical protein